MAESELRELGQPVGSHLRYLDEINAPSGLRRDPAVAAELAAQYAWLVERAIARIAARWPHDINQAWLASHATVALTRAASSVEDEADLAQAGELAIAERLRTLLAGTEWYREAMLGRARPLCEAWRGAVLAGREPTDRTLCARLRISLPELIERFVELATVFAVEPAGLMPGGWELGEGVAMAVGGLPDEERLVVSLYFEQDFTLAEVARVLDMLPVRVQELLGRAAAAIAGEATLTEWPAVAMRA